MKKLDEVLKQTGWSAATPAANAADAPAAEEPSEDACPDCGGAGFVRRTVRLGHPDFGKAFPCRCTDDEREDQRLARLRRYSNLGALLRLTFDDLMPRGRSPRPQDQERFARAVADARQFAEEPSGWLVFSGPSGCGKTHLVAAIANRCIEGGRPALFMVVPDLLDHLRAAYRPDSEIGYDDLFEMVRSAPLLILDDLGVHSSTPWADEKLYQLVNHRYQSRMATVFTTSREIGDLDPRLQTRLGDVTLSRLHRLESSRGGVMEIDGLELPLLRGMTFKAFDPQHLASDPEELKFIRDAYRQALKFAEEPRDWLVIAGGSGRGKTRLAAAIGNYRREADPGVLFVIVPDLLDRLRSSFNPQDPRAYDDVFEQVRNVPLLILDDLGSQTGTPWAEEKLFQLLNYRYNACLPTVITTSLTVKEMDARLASRLTDPQVSTILLMGRFDFWGREKAAAPRPVRGRGRRG
ncbi:MAG: ATP-binding protein, partial [Dehalococcoidia bacterium]|nr:ATP-binding protein [Dehalococcoidia bacterium]